MLRSIHILTYNPQRMITIRVNGEDRQIEPDWTVATLLEKSELAPIRVAVEVNRELVSRRDFTHTRLQPGDEVEIVTFVGGG